MNAEGLCISCMFWAGVTSDREASYDNGFLVRECRRKAPVPHVPPLSGTLHAGWPNTFAHDWCGEWQIVSSCREDAAQMLRGDS